MWTSVIVSILLDMIAFRTFQTERVFLAFITKLCYRRTVICWYQGKSYFFIILFESTKLILSLISCHNRKWPSHAPAVWNRCSFRGGPSKKCPSHSPLTVEVPSTGHHRAPQAYVPGGGGLRWPHQVPFVGRVSLAGKRRDGAVLSCAFLSPESCQWECSTKILILGNTQLSVVFQAAFFVFWNITKTLSSANCNSRTIIHGFPCCPVLNWFLNIYPYRSTSSERFAFFLTSWNCSDYWWTSFTGGLTDKRLNKSQWERSSRNT